MSIEACIWSPLIKSFCTCSKKYSFCMSLPPFSATLKLKIYTCIDFYFFYVAFLYYFRWFSFARNSSYSNIEFTDLYKYTHSPKLYLIFVLICFPHLLRFLLTSLGKKLKWKLVQLKSSLLFLCRHAVWYNPEQKKWNAQHYRFCHSIAWSISEWFEWKPSGYYDVCISSILYQQIANNVKWHK